MLRRSLLPSSFGRFSSSACFALPLLQQSFAFASTKSKSIVMKTQKKRGKGDKVDFAAIDMKEFSRVAETRGRDMFSGVLTRETRCRGMWEFAKKVARRTRETSDMPFMMRALSAFCALPYSGKTKITDLSFVQLLFPSDFALVNKILLDRVNLSLMREIVAEAPLQEDAIPLSLPFVKKLIGNTTLLSSLDRTIFQCWVLGCKVGDLHRQQRVFLPKHDLVLIRQQRMNSITSFIRYVPSTKEQFERVWKQSELKTSKLSFYLKLHSHIHKKLKSSAFLPSSIPEGAIKFLRDRGVSDKEITNVNGDGFVHTSLRTRSSRSPKKDTPRQQTRNITKLIKAIFPNGKY